MENEAKVKDLLHDIKQWFLDSDKSGFYKSAFNEPASAVEIAEVEQSINLKFPDPLKVFYQFTNGCGYGVFPEAGEFHSLKEVEENWKQLSEIQDDFDYSITTEDNYIESVVQGGSSEINPNVKPLPFSQKWIPFMSCDGHSFWYIDFNPPESSKYGQIIEVIDFDSWTVVSDSFENFLQEYHSQLIQNEYAVASDGSLVKTNELVFHENELINHAQVDKKFSTNLSIKEIHSLNTGDEFYQTGLVDLINFKLNEIIEFRNSLKKSAWFLRLSMKLSEWAAPKLSSDECFIHFGEHHLKLKNQVGDEWMKLKDSTVFTAKIKVVKGMNFELHGFKIMK